MSRERLDAGVQMDNRRVALLLVALMAVVAGMSFAAGYLSHGHHAVLDPEQGQIEVRP